MKCKALQRRSTEQLSLYIYPKNGEIGQMQKENINPLPHFCMFLKMKHNVGCVGLLMINNKLVLQFTSKLFHA